MSLTKIPRAAAAGLLAAVSACGGAAQNEATGKISPSLPPEPLPVLLQKQAAVPASPWGRPVLSEDFSGDHVNPGKWAVYDNATGENPRTRAATKVSGGALRLTGALYNGRDLSGGITTHLALTYGRWEARMRVEKGGGYSAVMLLTPTHQGNPEWLEVNFAEIPDPSRKVAGLFLHYGPKDETASKMVKGDFTKWHTFAVDWLPDRMTYWIDGKKVWTYRGRLVPRKADVHLALQNDVSCYTQVQCRNSTTPAKVTMYVDWVRIYRAPAR